MLQEIKIGIAQSLDKEFENMNVYTDNIRQGLDVPCFLITPLISTENELLGNRYERSYPFMVQYFPKEDAYQAECAEVQEKLFNCLEYINVNENVVRGTDMSGRIVNDILNFEVTYDRMIWKVRNPEERELMQALEQHIQEKE